MGSGPRKAPAGLKVLVLSHLFPREAQAWGGIFVQEQVRTLRDEGVDARVVTGDPVWLTRRTLKEGKLHHFFRWVPAAEWSEIQGVPRLTFPYLAAGHPVYSGLDSVSYRRQIKRLAKHVRVAFAFDLVHAHTAFLDGSAGMWLAQRFRVPLVLTEHTGPFSALTAQLGMRGQTERAINGADAMIAVSETLKRTILQHVRVRRSRHIHVVGNGVNPELFHPDGSVPPDDGTVRALWVGGFLPIKQPLMLIDAFAAAREKDPRLRLSLVGKGPLEDAIRARIALRRVKREVAVLPSATRPMVADHMRRHHFLVISSEAETFGLVAVEALACGRPVLSTRCGGPEETLRDKRFGELVSNSQAGLAEGFVAISARLGEFDPMALHDYVSGKYSLRVIANRLQEIYADVLQVREGRHY